MKFVGTSLLVAALVQLSESFFDLRSPSIISSPVLKASNTSASVNTSKFSSYFGYSLQLEKNGANRVIVGAPKFVDTMQLSRQEAPDYRNAKGNILSCPILSETPCTPHPLTSGYPRDGLGLDIATTANEELVACAATRNQVCQNVSRNPGFCFRRQRSDQSWKPDRRSSLQERCGVPLLDIIFLVDGSGSINKVQFSQIKNWTKDTASRFFQYTDTQLGVVQYSGYVPSRALNDQPYIVTEIELGSAMDSSQFYEEVENIEQIGRGTYTAQALNKTVFDFMNSTRFNDADTQQVLILLTDGKSRQSELLRPSADYIRSLDILTFAVGVGEADPTELRAVATGTESDERVYYVQNFNQLNDIINALTAAITSSAIEGSSTANQPGNTFSYAQYGITVEPSKNAEVKYGYRR